METGFDMRGERDLRVARMGFDASDASDLRSERPQASLAPHVPQVVSRAPLTSQVSQVASQISRAPQAASQPPHVPQAPRLAHATPIIGAYGGYRKTLAFGYVCLIYHATTLFCRRNYDYKSDPLGKTSGQMVGAARSARQNIVEGSSRAGTSKETELRLYDVARGSLEELAGDYEAYLIDMGSAPWSERDARFQELAALRLDAFEATDDVRHLHGAYVLAMRQRFAPWLESDDPVVAANAQLVIINRAAALLHKQMVSLGETFAEEGCFTERLSKVRLEVRDAKAAAAGAPTCPVCGGPMRKVVARKGRNAGNPFWSCCAYPNCQGTRPWGRGLMQETRGA